MKKILGLAIAAMLIMATVGFGTWAYFSDTETSTTNAVLAGTLDLTLDAGNSNVNILTGLTNKAPGDSGQLYTVLKNVGSLTGELDIASGVVTNTGGAGGKEYEDGVGHLGGVAEIAIWIDVDESFAWSSGDIGLKYDGTTYAHPTALDYAAVNNYASKNWGGTGGIQQMLTTAQDNFYISWRIPTSAGNNIQGDSFSFGLTFTLEQPAAD